MIKSTYICSPLTTTSHWEHSSAGSEHLPYKQGVTGSNPVAPTKWGISNNSLEPPIFISAISRTKWAMYVNTEFTFVVRHGSI